MIIIKLNIKFLNETNCSRIDSDGCIYNGPSPDRYKDVQLKQLKFFTSLKEDPTKLSFYTIERYNNKIK